MLVYVRDDADVLVSHLLSRRILRSRGWLAMASRNPTMDVLRPAAVLYFGLEASVERARVEAQRLMEHQSAPTKRARTDGTGRGIGEKEKG